MEQLRVSKGIDICVNDDGETICLECENTAFIDKYNGLINAVQKIADSIDENAELDEKEVLALQREKMSEIVEEIDKALGKDTCKKVFGKDVIPTAFAVIDFFEQLTPIVEKYSKKRTEKISAKYSTNRKGGKRV